MSRHPRVKLTVRVRRKRVRYDRDEAFNACLEGTVTRRPRLDFVSVSQEFMEDAYMCVRQSLLGHRSRPLDPCRNYTVRKVKTFMIERYSLRNAA